MRVANTALVAGGISLAVFALSGCGSSGGLLSSGQQSQLDAQLQQTSQALTAGDCQGAANAVAGFRNTVDGLDSVDGTLLSDLYQAATQLAAVTERDCPTVTSTGTTTTTTTAKPKHTKTTTTATSTTTTPTTTATITTTTTTPTTTTPTTPTTTTPTTTTTTTSTSTTGGTGLSGTTGTSTTGTGTETTTGGAPSQATG